MIFKFKTLSVFELESETRLGIQLLFSIIQHCSGSSSSCNKDKKKKRIKKVKSLERKTQNYMCK